MRCARLNPMTKRLFAYALLLALVGTAGCGRGASPGGGAPLDPNWPAGVTFVSTKVTGTAKPLVAGTRVTLLFDRNGTIVGSAGCNTMSGPAHIDGGKLVVTDMAMTVMGCLGDRGSQDGWLSDILNGRPNLAFAGDRLTVRAGAVTIDLQDRRSVDPDRPLVGSDWNADTIMQRDVATSIPIGSFAGLIINKDNTFAVSIECADGGPQHNAVSGTVVATDNTLTFTVGRSLPCANTADPLSAAVQSTFRGTVTYAIEAEELTLTAADGSGLRFVVYK